MNKFTSQETPRSKGKTSFFTFLALDKEMRQSPNSLTRQKPGIKTSQLQNAKKIKNIKFCLGAN